MNLNNSRFNSWGHQIDSPVDEPEGQREPAVRATLGLVARTHMNDRSADVIEAEGEHLSGFCLQ